MRTVAARIPAYRSSQATAASERLEHIERVARLMDSIFVIPGTKFRFGLDPLIGLIPGLGNLATFAVSAMLVRTMMQHGASGHVAVRMALNVLVDTVIGAIPIVGNVFDFAFRSNNRNIELLRRHYGEGRYQGSGRVLATAILLGLCLFLGVVLWGAWQVLAWAWHALAIG